MNRLKHVSMQRQLRRNRIRAVVQGTSERPRLSVHISHQHVSAQVIDDTKQSTLAAATTVGQKNTGKNLTEKATWIGQEIAKQAKSAKVSKVVFDRAGRAYHGRVQALATAAREKGLDF